MTPEELRDLGSSLWNQCVQAQRDGNPAVALAVAAEAVIRSQAEVCERLDALRADLDQYFGNASTLNANLCGVYERLGKLR